MLIKVLKLIDSLIVSDRSAADLRRDLEVSDRTFKRYVKEAQHLGADLESYRQGGRHYWRIANPECISVERLHRWIDLESQRDVTFWPEV